MNSKRIYRLFDSAEHSYRFVRAKSLGEAYRYALNHGYFLIIEHIK